jgi:hypothetical protein
VTVGELIAAGESFLKRLEANPSYAEVKAAAAELRPILTALIEKDEQTEPAPAEPAADESSPQGADSAEG